jgi:fatty acid desaturase
MKIWMHSAKDAFLPLLGVTQLTSMALMAMKWEHLSLAGRSGCFVLLIFLMTYDIIVITHLFTHTPWFQSQTMNSVASMLNSINIGQSAEAYKLTHVRNHHRYNNDQPGPDGNTNDLSSTYREGIDGEHATLSWYAFGGAASTLVNVGRALLSGTRLWRVGEQEHELLDLTAKSPDKRIRELRQIQLDRMAQFVGVGVFLALSWKWVLLCYLPAFYIVLALVNIQNYYEHYGAMPESRYADSVSYYGRLYNLLTFNDGYHQEHHLRPQAHWSTMPKVRSEHRDQLDQIQRVVSPVPAIVGFLHRTRPKLHGRPLASAGLQNRKEKQDELAAAGSDH